jgi:hypothetical protein
MIFTPMRTPSKKSATPQLEQLAADCSKQRPVARRLGRGRWRDAPTDVEAPGRGTVACRWWPDPAVLEREVPRERAGLVNGKDNLSDLWPEIGHLEHKRVVAARVAQLRDCSGSGHRRRNDLDIGDGGHAVRRQDLVEYRCHLRSTVSVLSSAQHGCHRPPQ